MNEQNNLPKYWAVKHDGSKLFKDTVVAYINKVGNLSYLVVLPDYYYAYDGSAYDSGFNTKYNPLDFENSPVILTIDDFTRLIKTKQSILEEVLIDINKRYIDDDDKVVLPKHKQQFTIGGTLNLRKAFVADSGIEIYHELSYNYPNLTLSDRGRDSDKSIVYRITGRTEKRSLHFQLPKDWNEAMEYIKFFVKREFKVGDWITVESLPSPTNHWLHETNQRTFKLIAVPSDFPGFRELMWSTSGVRNEYIDKTIAGYAGIPEICFRIATKEEREAAKKIGTIELKFGDVVFKIKKGDDFATTTFGKVTSNELAVAINYIKHPPKLCGHDFNVFMGGYRYAIGNSDNHHKFEIGFGCKKGTISELEAILKAINENKVNA